MNPVIQVRNLKKHYGKFKAVDGISLSVEKGEIFGLLGHNGAGKTTAVECMTGTKQPDGGEVAILSQDPQKERKRLFQRVGVQFQGTAFQDRLKVRELCRLNQSLYRQADPWQIVLERFGLAEKQNSFVSSLSGGQRQMLALALAVMHRPEVLFLDELTTGLDPKARRKVWQYLNSLKKQGTTVFLTSHYMEELEALCDRVAVMRQGRFLTTGKVGQVITTSGQATLEQAYLHFMEEDII